MLWCVYILEMQDGRFYTGTTNNVSRRIAEHKEGKGAKFTRDFGCKDLLYTEEYSTKTEALKRERQLQGWTHSKKKALIEGNIKLLKTL